MNFLSSALSTLTGQLIPYNKGNFVLRVENLWDLYDGTSKADGSAVSIFQFDKQQFRSMYKFFINCARKLSIIKIPGVLRVVEVIDQDLTLYLVTEHVKPLSSSVDSVDSKLIGIYDISKALRFLHQETNSVHGKINHDAVFVTDSGEWKLGGFELLTNLNDQERLITQGDQLDTFHMNVHPPEFHTDNMESLVKGKYGMKFDSYKLGCLILQIYNDYAKVTASDVTDYMKKVPKQLQPGVKKLLSDSVTTRLSVDLFVRKGEESFFNTESIEISRQLQELDFKSNEEKLEIFEKISASIDSFSKGFVENKALTLLVQLFQYNEQQPQPSEITSKVLYHILQMSKYAELDQQKFNKIVKPIVFACFAKNDRATRMILLTSLGDYIDKLDKSDISNTIFSHLVTGFNDTSPEIREETLKTIVVIAEFLNDRQLNNELLRYLLKLQNDESETIRTNVVICLSKIAHLMNKNSRLNILITAFNKSIKDPFIPTRLSTIILFGSCIEMFTPEIIASRILSSIAPSLLDKSVKIRQELSKMFQVFFDIILKELEKLPQEIDQQEDSKDVENLSSKLLDTTLGWGALNRFATPPIVDESNTNVKKSNNPQSLDYEFQDEDNDLIEELDDWGEDEEELQVKPIVAPKPKPSTPRSFARKTTTQTRTRTTGDLKLQSKSRSSKLKMDLKIDDDDATWGDGWD